MPQPDHPRQRRSGDARSATRTVAALRSTPAEHPDGGQSDNRGAAMKDAWRFDRPGGFVYAGRGRVLRSGPRPQLSPCLGAGREAALRRLLLFLRYEDRVRGHEVALAHLTFPAGDGSGSPEAQRNVKSAGSGTPWSLRALGRAPCLPRSFVAPRARSRLRSRDPEGRGTCRTLPPPAPSPPRARRGLRRLGRRIR